MKLKNCFAILACITSMFLFAISANAEVFTGECGEYLTWSFDSETGVLEIEGEGEMRTYSSFSNTPWASHKDLIKSVEIGENITSISTYAFDGSASIENIDIGNDVEKIENYAFRGCTALNELIIPDNTKTIGSYSFSSCTNLATVTIGANVECIGGGAFNNCINLADISVGDKITSIGGYAFAETAYYNNAKNWENSIFLYVGEYLIKAKTSISGKYALHAGTKLIADSAFLDCTSLTGITLPDGVVAIGHSAFNECERLASITLPQSLKTISNYALHKYIRGSYEYTLPLSNIYFTSEKVAININISHSFNHAYSSATKHYLATHTFETNGGSAVDPITDYSIETAPETVLDGMTFAGWYDNTEFTGEPIVFPYKSENDATFYAKWVCTVTYTGELSDSFTVEPGDSIELPTAPDGFEYKFISNNTEWTGENITTDTTVEVLLIDINKKCEIEGINTPIGEIIRENGVITTIKVPNSTDTAIFDITVSDGASWKMYRNSSFTSVNSSNSVSLPVAGDTRNVYIKVTAPDGETTAEYTISVYRNTKTNAPVIAENNKMITITADGCDIYYTTNGGEPTEKSTKYTAPFAAISGAKIKAIAKHPDMDEFSDITSFTASTFVTTTIDTYYTSLNNGSFYYEFEVTSDATPSGVFIIALYSQSGKLINLKAIDVDTATDGFVSDSLKYSETPHSYKAFFWESLDSMTPICDFAGSDI